MTSTLPTIAVTSPVKSRDPFLDNARYWVMLLVVVGHFMTELQDIPVVRGFYTWIYLFHMPVFILISGFTARRYVGDARQIKRMISTLVIPYLLVESGLEITEMVLAGEPGSLHVLEPDWLTWFIAALFIWRLTTPIWLAIRWPIPVSIIVSVIGGLAPDGDVLAIPQVIGFLPFYVVGMHLHRAHFDLLVRPWIRAASIVALVVALVVCQLRHEDWVISWLYYRDGYSEDPLLAGPFAGMLDRGSLLALGFVLAFAALALVPQRRAWFSRLGQRTLYCYLLHGFAILWLDHVGFFEDVVALGVRAAVFVALGAVLVATVLMSAPVSRPFRPLFEPELGWLFKPRTTTIDE